MYTVTEAGNLNGKHLFLQMKTIFILNILTLTKQRCFPYVSGDPGRRAQREIFIPELKSRLSEQEIYNSSKQKPLHIPNLQGCKYSKVREPTSHQSG